MCNCFVKKTRIFLVLFCIFIFGTSFAFGVEKPFEPWDFTSRPGINPPAVYRQAPSNSTGGALLIGAVRFYQRHLSSIIGDRCPMFPSCSAYSIQAIQKHGFFIGGIMTADRLIRENNEMELAPMVKIGDEFRFYDSVERNDFWWHETVAGDK